MSVKTAPNDASNGVRGHAWSVANESDDDGGVEAAVTAIYDCCLFVSSPASRRRRPLLRHYGKLRHLSATSTDTHHFPTVPQRPDRPSRC